MIYFHAVVEMDGNIGRDELLDEFNSDCAIEKIEEGEGRKITMEIVTFDRFAKELKECSGNILHRVESIDSQAKIKITLTQLTKTANVVSV